MARVFDDFQTYTSKIWNRKPDEPETPEYAYFCWRWDEKHSRERERNSYPRASDPIEDKDLKDDVLESFVYNQEMYHILMEMKTVGPSLNHSLAIVLWDTYGHTPTRLLHMWRWAKSSDAFSMCPWAVDTECARPACKAWDYYYQERASKLMTFKANSYCQGAGAKILAELDPSLISFNNKLWSDVADRSGNELPNIPVGPDRHQHYQFLYSLQSFFFTVYNELISSTIMDAIKVLQIPTTPDVSFLLIDEERAGRHEQELNEEQKSSQLPLILFAVAGSGKTQSIFNHLAANWGHYLVSGHISDSLAHQDSLLSPRRGGASADTHWLFELFKRIKTKNDQPLNSAYYSSAIVELLANRQTLMKKWIDLTDAELSGAQLRQCIHWLLFQTTCTPAYDPFIKTLELRMLLGPFATLNTETYKPTSISLTVIDEAQNELDPFWNKQPPLFDFINANSLFRNRVSISGTSLRMKDCQEVVCRASRAVTQPQHVESLIALLLRAFRDFMGSQECSHFAKLLADRVLEGYNAKSGEKQLSDFLQGTEFTNILGDFYFTETLQKAKQKKDESTWKLLEEAKDFLIPILGSYHKFLLQSYFPHAKEDQRSNHWSREKQGVVKEILRESFTTHHNRLWGRDETLTLSDVSKIWVHDLVNPEEHIFVGLLREKLTSSSLNQTPETFNLILSDQCFSALLGAHIKRLLRRVGYFCSLGDETIKREFWRVACPETVVFQSTEDADGRKEFFRRAKALLEKYANTNSPTGHEMQSAAEIAERDFRQAFVEKAQMNDKSDEWRSCGITRYSALFRGRMRWSIVYIEHVFAFYLKTLGLKPAQTNGTSRYISPSIDAGGSIQADHDILGFVDAEEPMFETATNPNSPKMPFQIEEEAKEAAKYIKSSLKHRIEVLHNNGHYLLLKDLYFTAIRADLMHKPSIFPSDRSARMITEGFALLDPAESKYAGSTSAPRQKLSEPIVVDAVIEYLHDMTCDDEDNLENVLRNFLFDNQDDASSFGKAAEFYFAWSLGGLFSQSSDSLRLSFKARENFREKIGQANFISTGAHIAQVLGKIQGYDGYTLEEPSPELVSDLTLGSTIPFSEWLRRVRDGEFFPTFHFPSTLAGPDIVFCLKSQNTEERILCAFQIKTGEKCDKSDAFKLIRTLDPNLWFWTAPNLREDLINELENWQSDRILTALVITSRPCIEFFASESDFYNGMIALQPHIQGWELCRKLYHSKIYKELTSEVDKLKKTTSLPENATSILEGAKSLAKGLSQNILDSASHDSTTFAKELILKVEGAMDVLLNAAKSIYKAPSKREDEKAEQNDIVISDYDNDGISMQDDRRANGYYFAILDDLALEPFLGSTFYYLCKAMKEVETAKDKNLVRAEEAFESQVYRCPVTACKKHQVPYKSKAWFNKHMLDEHPEHEPEAKRINLDPSAMKNGSQAGNNNDVGMAETGDLE